MKYFHFPNVFMGNIIIKKKKKRKKNKLGNKLILFEIAKNNEMMSSVLSNIFGWPGGNSSKQVRLIHMHASRQDSVTLAQPTQARCGL